jgi:hypothetical protein
MHVAIAFSALLLVPAAAPRAHAQMDDHFRRAPAEQDGGLAHAFAIDSNTAGPIAIERVEQARQAYGDPRFAVHAKNRTRGVVAAFVVTAFVVGGDGRVKASQRMSAVKNLRGGQVRRREFSLRSAVLAPSDLLVFAVTDVQPAGGTAWRAIDEELRAMMRDAAESYRRALARRQP